MAYRELYQYRKLADSDAIRLIVLHPSVDLEDIVECDLLHTSLAECEEDVFDHYTAISYVWGDPGGHENNLGRWKNSVYHCYFGLSSSEHTILEQTHKAMGCQTKLAVQDTK